MILIFYKPDDVSSSSSSGLVESHDSSQKDAALISSSVAVDPVSTDKKSSNTICNNFSYMKMLFEHAKLQVQLS